MKDIPAVPLQYQAFRWHYVKGYLYTKEGRVASHYYLWRAEHMHGQGAIDAYNAGRSDLPPLFGPLSKLDSPAQTVLR